ncbi:MAG: hypothetical protein ACK559_13515, partial [bacterium]
MLGGRARQQARVHDAHEPAAAALGEDLQRALQHPPGFAHPTVLLHHEPQVHPHDLRAFGAGLLHAPQGLPVVELSRVEIA